MKVYIILLNYKGWQDTVECLESVFKLNYQNFQVIVVDNSPTEESLANIEGWASGKGSYEVSTRFAEIVCPLQPKPIEHKIISEAESEINFYDEQLLIIKADKNRGFAAGNNIALNYAIRREDFDFCWLLNNDTVVEKESLNNQILYLENQHTLPIGILGSKLIYYFKPDTIQAVGGAFNPKLFVSSHIGEGVEYNREKKSFQKIDYVVGASMLVTKKFLEDVGTLSEDYFLYYEELDWTYRAKERGWEVDWCPTSIIYHKEGISIGSSSNPKERSTFSEINVFTSRKIFYKKFFKKSPMFWISSFLIIANRLRRLQFRLAVRFFEILIAKE